MDEAAAKLKMEITSKPVELDDVDRKLLQLEMERLSLKRDNDLAHKLANTFRYVRDREAAELTAVVEGLPGPTDETARHSQRILEDAQVTLQPLAAVDEFAQSVRRELQM